MTKIIFTDAVRPNISIGCRFQLCLDTASYWLKIRHIPAIYKVPIGGEFVENSENDYQAGRNFRRALTVSQNNGMKDVSDGRRDG